MAQPGRGSALRAGAVQVETDPLRRPAIGFRALRKGRDIAELVWALPLAGPVPPTVIDARAARMIVWRL